jgi:hypothetical protein
VGANLYLPKGISRLCIHSTSPSDSRRATIQHQNNKIKKYKVWMHVSWFNLNAFYNQICAQMNCFLVADENDLLLLLLCFGAEASLNLIG